MLGAKEKYVQKCGIIDQVMDEKEGPTTKREFDISMVPVGQELIGSATDFLGRQNHDGRQLGTDKELPLFNEQAPMDDREQIQEPLFTGLKVILAKGV